jgi:3,4-dihydroxy 2-butanone 4-phosphate synthase
VDFGSSLAAFRRGGVIAVYDGQRRENEVDLCVKASDATPARVNFLRTHAGGMLCVALGSEVSRRLGIEFQADILKRAGLGALAYRKTAYGDLPALALWVNHAKVRTGVTDEERALTIRALGTLARKPSRAAFEKQFRSPGHVATLISRGLENRRGHTELACALARMAGREEAVAVCEMLQGTTRRTYASARKFCARHSIPMFSSKEIIGEYSKWQEKRR